MRTALTLLGTVSTGLTTVIVTRMFCKPARKKIGEKQRLFYKDGITETLRIRGYTIKVFKKGNGKPVYVTHGWGSYGYDMKPLVHTLIKEKYQVILPDLPCHGRSSGRLIDQIEMAKVIEALLLHYNAQSPIEIMVTHSWGGTAALLALDRIMKSDRPGFRIRKMVSVSMPSFPNAITDIFCNTLRLSEPIKKGLALNLVKIARNDHRTVEEAFPIGLTGLLGEARFDYLLIHGKSDAVVSCTNTTRLADAFPHIRTQLEEGLGHVDILKQEKVHAAIIRHFETLSYP